MNVTDATVLQWWRVLNDVVFGGVLNDPIAIKLVNHHNEYAWAIPVKHRCTRITMNAKFSTTKLFLMVLVHEMVHAWEHYMGYKMSHSPNFTKWAKPIFETTTLRLKKQLKELDGQ